MRVTDAVAAVLFTFTLEGAAPVNTRSLVALWIICHSGTLFLVIHRLFLSISLGARTRMTEYDTGPHRRGRPRIPAINAPNCKTEPNRPASPFPSPGQYPVEQRK